jgi:predicted O-linked N-acetylglucosamine transferase (SPINDLY family)
MKILKQVPNSYFLIQGAADEETVKKLFTQIAEAEGVSSDRLRFIPEYPTEIYRANLAIADVVLDTYPFNGGTTTLDILWREIPVVTKVGQQWAARLGYSLLMNAGISEGIAWSDEEYIDWGVRLGTDENLRKEVTWKLRKSKQSAPIWKGKQFTQEMEKAYQQMWEIYCQSQEI